MHGSQVLNNLLTFDISKIQFILTKLLFLKYIPFCMLYCFNYEVLFIATPNFFKFFDSKSPD